MKQNEEKKENEDLIKQKLSASIVKKIFPKVKEKIEI